jgi:gluconate 2-dehydrogenase gamma chain
MTPVEAYRSGLTALDRHTQDRYGQRFAESPEHVQFKVIDAWSNGQIDSFEGFRGEDFFKMVRDNVSEGLFSDPAYGGNREMIGWRRIGYPGVAAAQEGDYAELVERYGEPYAQRPKSLNWRAE